MKRISGTLSALLLALSMTSCASGPADRPVVVVEGSGMAGLEGRRVIPWDPDDLVKFQGDYYSIRTGGEVELHDVLPELFWTPKVTFTEGLCPARKVKAGKVGYIDEMGRWVIPPSYDTASHFSEGRASVEVDGKWAMIDRQGRFVVPPQRGYKSIGALSGGLASFDTGADWGCGYLDRDGRVVLPPRYGTAGDFSDGLALVDVAGEMESVYIDRTGAVRIRFEEEFTVPSSSFEEGRAGFRGLLDVDNEVAFKYGFIDVEGKEVIPPQYGVVKAFQEGLAAVTREGDRLAVGPPFPAEKWGYIDLDGKGDRPVAVRRRRQFLTGPGTRPDHRGVVAIHRPDRPRRHTLSLLQGGGLSRRPRLRGNRGWRSRLH